MKSMELRTVIILASSALFFFVLGSSCFDQDAVEFNGVQYQKTRQDRDRLQATGFSCHSDLHTNLCVTDKPVWIDTKSPTIYTPIVTTKPVAEQDSIKPYPRKDDETAMESVSPLNINLQTKSLPNCHFNHTSPAIVFSTGGFAGNLFHELNEIIIPLFITAQHFKSNLQFIMTDYNPTLARKYEPVLRLLSQHTPLHSTTNATIHCFPGAVFGLVYHDNLAVNSTKIPGGYSTSDFKSFLRRAYNLKRSKILKPRRRPKLVFMSRERTRTFLNENETVRLMQEIGFRVHVASPNETADLNWFSRVVNSCHIMVGAHGAGLANKVFLPNGAAMVQVVPLGLDWASENYYGNLTAD